MKWEKIPVTLPFSTYTPLKSPTFYHTFIPVLFRFGLPSITTYSSIYAALCVKDIDGTDEDIIPSQANCTSASVGTQSTTTKPPSVEDTACTTLKHLSELFESHEQTHRPWKPLPKFQRSGSMNTDLSLIPCDEIIPHFDNFKVSVEEFERYEVRLEECLFGSSVIVIPEPPVEERSDFEKLLLAAKNSSSYTIEAGKDDSASGTGSPEPLDLVVAMQQASISHLQLERAKWFEAFSDCRAKIIPTTLIDYLSLENALDLVNETAIANNLKFSVETLHGYYSLPLSDCVLLEETNFLVRVLVPVLKTEENFQLLRPTSIPSVVLRGNLVEICDSLDHNVIVSDNSLLEKTCQPSKLCLMDGSERRESIAGHCLAPRIRPFQGTPGKCRSQCYKLSADYLPILRRSDSNKFVVVGTSNTTVQIHCESDILGNNHALEFNRTTILEVVLPCGCEIFYNVTHRAVSPCARGSVITVTELESMSPVKSEGDPLQNRGTSNVIGKRQIETFTYTLGTGSHENDEVDKKIHQLQRDIHFLWFIVIGLGSLLALAVIFLSCFGYRMKKMKREFIKSNDHRSTFYSFTDMAMT